MTTDLQVIALRQTSNTFLINNSLHAKGTFIQQVSHAATSRRRTCNALPEWLANTFMSLSKKHPLRLLLPSGLAQSPPGEVHNKTDAAVLDESVSPDAVFAFNVPVSTENDSRDLDFQKPTSHDGARHSRTRALSDPFWSELPKPSSFSTPKGSLPGSSLASKTVFSLASPHTNSSPTLYNTESHLFSDRPLTPVFQSCSISPVTAQPHLLSSSDGLDSDPIPLDFTDISYFSDIYATPGPTYHASSAHFDPSTQDSLSSEPNLTPAQSFNDTLGFHWKPFDRKSLIVPPISRTPSFLFGGHSSGHGPLHADNYMTSRSGALIDPDDIPLAVSHIHCARPGGVINPASPSTFCFVPSDVYQNSVSHTFPAQPDIVPGSQDLAQDAQTPQSQKRPFAPAPNVFISPLGQSLGRTSASPQNVLTSRISKVSFVLYYVLSLSISYYRVKICLKHLCSMLPKMSTTTKSLVISRVKSWKYCDFHCD